MRMKIGLAGIGVVFGSLSVAACGTDPTGARIEGESSYSVEELPGVEGELEEGGRGAGETTAQSDTTTQRGIGGFGSGN